MATASRAHKPARWIPWAAVVSLLAGALLAAYGFFLGMFWLAECGTVAVDAPIARCRLPSYAVWMGYLLLVSGMGLLMVRLMQRLWGKS